MAQKQDPPETNWVRLKSGAPPVAPAPASEPRVTPPPRRVGPAGAGGFGGFAVAKATSLVRRKDANLAKWVAVAFLVGVLLLSIVALGLFLLIV